jgi:hypothetical protein
MGEGSREVQSANRGGAPGDEKRICWWWGSFFTKEKRIPGRLSERERDTNGTGHAPVFGRASPRSSSPMSKVKDSSNRDPDFGLWTTRLWTKSPERDAMGRDTRRLWAGESKVFQSKVKDSSNRDPDFGLWTTRLWTKSRNGTRWDGTLSLEAWCPWDAF